MDINDYNKENEILNDNKEKEILNDNKENEIINDAKENEIINDAKEDEIINDAKEEEILNDNKVHEKNFEHEKINSNDNYINNNGVHGEAIRLKEDDNGDDKGLKYNRNFESEQNHLTGKDDDKSKRKLSEEKKEEEDELAYLKDFPPVSYCKLQFALAGPKEILFYCLGNFGAVLMGCCFPIFAILFGESLNEFGQNDTEAISKAIGEVSKKLVYVGLGMFTGTFLNIFFNLLCGESLIKKIKQEYFRALLRQEQAFYDSRNAYEFSTKVQSQIKIIHSGLGTKVGNAIMSISMFIAAFVVGFIVSWKLSLVLLSIVPLMTVGGYFMVKGLTESTSKARKYFEVAGGIAEEVLYNIKTVASFSNFGFERERFNHQVTEAYNKGKYGGLIASISRAFVFFCIFAGYALAIGAGSKFIADKDINHNSKEPFRVGDILTVIFTIIFGSFTLGQAAPNIKAINAACDGSREFFFMKERKPDIDTSKSVEKPPSDGITGKITFEDVGFSYPSKSERKILNKLNWTFEDKKTTAIVGETGSGKSTIINLLERLYDPQDGKILIDGKDIKHFDLEYYRSLIGYVPQEPVLFNTTLRENIIFGRKDVTKEEIEEACEKAYLNDFIPKLSLGLETRVGIKGSKLSGGQKQRVAIARAILKKPKILMLDEATSALDYKSEKVVKKALDEISKNLTTIIIAHRLSTVRNADTIIVLKEGEIKEEGNHEKLFNQKGLYYLLVKNQETADNKVNNEVEKDENLTMKKRKSLENNQVMNNEEFHIPTRVEKLNSLNKEIKKLDNHKEISKEILARKLLLEDDELTINDRRNLLEDLEFLRDKIAENAKQGLWPIICENPGYMVISTISAILDGAIWPLYGFLLAEVIFKLSTDDPVELKSEGVFLSGMFLIIAVISGVANFFEGNFFSLIGEHLSMRMRQKIYAKYLKLDIAFYDYTENSPGALLAKLATDTIRINGIALSICAILFGTTITLLIGVIMGFIFCWQLALVCIGFVPFMILASALGLKMQMGFAKNDEIKDKDLGNILSESVINTKTLYCFNMQDQAFEMYRKKMDDGESPNCIYFFSSIMAGLGQLLMFAVYAVTFYVGAVLIQKYPEDIDFGDVLKSIFSLLFSAFGLGMAQQYLGDMDEARKSLISIHNILNTESLIDPEPESEIMKKGKNDEKSGENKNVEDNKDRELKQIRVKKEDLIPKIEFKGVNFSYPTRPEIQIFKDLSFTINEGEQVAFVGFSGSGKSTIIQLILRFYDIDSGEILINDVNIKDYNLIDLRQCIGIVMQEPVLFKLNIYKNIQYGKLDATHDEIIKCAEKAQVPRIELIKENCKDALPVSGGEKQRIAIARCMLRNPKILLLDEATSALDKNVEEEVQKSLDILMENKTSIVIAHRLSTIVNCTKIFFLEMGEIKESGTHDELIKKEDRYYSLYTSSFKR